MIPKYSLTQKGELYNYLNDVNYGMKHSNFKHLYTFVKGLININGQISLTRVSKEIFDSKHYSTISRFLSSYNWNHELINRNRIGYINHYLNSNLKRDSIGFLAIDDTVNPKMKSSKTEGVSFNHSHTLHKNIKSHCIVSSNFVCGNISIPIDYKCYLNKANSEALNKNFKSKPDIAMDLISKFDKPSNVKKLYCLTDSWYTSYKLIDFCRGNNVSLIGAIKSNRLMAHDGEKMQIKEFVKTLNLSNLDIVTIKKKKFRVFNSITTLGKKGIKAKIFLCFEKDDDGLNHPLYLVTTDLKLTPKQAILYYQKRWNIEVNYKYLKSYLGFADYTIRRFKAIERYFLLTFLAINFLTMHKNKKKITETLGKVIRYYQRLNKMIFIKYIYDLVKQNYDINQIFKKIKLVT